MKKIELLVIGIMSGDPLQEWKGREPRLWFGHRLVKDDRVIPENYSYVFFEPGIEQEYRYISKVPYNCKFLLVRGQFLYAKGNPHSAERVVTVKASCSAFRRLRGARPIASASCSPLRSTTHSPPIAMHPFLVAKSANPDAEVHSIARVSLDAEYLP